MTMDFKEFISVICYNSGFEDCFQFQPDNEMKILVKMIEKPVSSRDCLALFSRPGVGRKSLGRDS